MSRPDRDWHRLVEELVTLMPPADFSVEAWDVFTRERQALLERIAELAPPPHTDSDLSLKLQQQYDAVNEGIERLLEHQRQVAGELSRLRRSRSRLKRSILTPKSLSGSLDVTA